MTKLSSILYMAILVSCSLYSTARTKITINNKSSHNFTVYGISKGTDDKVWLKGQCNTAEVLQECVNKKKDAIKSGHVGMLSDLREDTDCDILCRAQGGWTGKTGRSQVNYCICNFRGINFTLPVPAGQSIEKYSEVDTLVNELVLKSDETGKVTHLSTWWGNKDVDTAHRITPQWIDLNLEDAGQSRVRITSNDPLGTFEIDGNGDFKNNSVIQLK